MKLIFPCSEEQVRCVEEYDQYIPPLWVMCLESVAHLLVMLNFSTNFLIYCSVSAPFKKALSKVGKIEEIESEEKKNAQVCMVLCGKQIAKDDESRGGVTPSRATEDTAFYTQVTHFSIP